MSCIDTKCAKQHLAQRKQQTRKLADIATLNKLKNDKKISNAEYTKLILKLGTSKEDKKVTRAALECSLKHCLNDYKKSLKVMLSKVETICASQNRKEVCDKLVEIKASLKNGMLSVEQYAWLFKLLHKIDVLE
jgi:hypothetical protein